MRRRLITIYVLLTASNIGLWGLALFLFHDRPVQLGAALLAYGFGLRHAVDADHIAAIDNVTRKLMQSGQRPIDVGLYFSLGHSTVVVVVSLVLVLTASTMRERIASVAGLGGIVGSLVSISFLLIVAAINLSTLVSIYRANARARRGDGLSQGAVAVVPAPRGLLSRIFACLFRLVERSWHMYPIGLLFGLGFDTATEIGLLTLSAGEAGRSGGVWWVMIYPALFTAGMSLVDTLDSTLMTGAYGWALVEPSRKLTYNVAITAISVTVAVIICGFQILALARARWALTGQLWSAVAIVTDHFASIGYSITALLAVCWAASAWSLRLRKDHAGRVNNTPATQRAK